MCVYGIINEVTISHFFSKTKLEVIEIFPEWLQ